MSSHVFDKSHMNPAGKLIWGGKNITAEFDRLYSGELRVNYITKQLTDID